MPYCQHRHADRRTRFHILQQLAMHPKPLLHRSKGDLYWHARRVVGLEELDHHPSIVAHLDDAVAVVYGAVVEEKHAPRLRKRIHERQLRTQAQRMRASKAHEGVEDKESAPHTAPAR